MSVELTPDDEDKTVVTAADRNAIGRVAGVEDGAATVEPAGGEAEAERVFGAAGPFRLPPEAVQLVDDGAVVLDDRLGVSFQEREVGASDDHQRAFFGSFGYWKDGRKHVLEREFDVYTDPEYVEAGKPTAEVHDVHVVDDRDDGDGDDATVVAEDDARIVVDVDPGLDDLLRETRVREFCEAWHVDHLERA